MSGVMLFTRAAQEGAAETIMAHLEGLYSCNHRHRAHPLPSVVLGQGADTQSYSPGAARLFPPPTVYHGPRTAAGVVFPAPPATDGLSDACSRDEEPTNFAL